MIMFKILQARLQQYMNQELPDVQAGLRKSIEIKLPTSAGSQIKQGNYRRTFTSALLSTVKPLTGVDQNTEWKILKEMGISDHLTCLLINWCAGQETTGRTGHGTMNWFKIEKGVWQGCVSSPCLFKLYVEYIMQNVGLDESQALIKIARRNINNLRYADDITLMAESEEELKSFLMRVKEESEKAGLKLNIQKIKIMASGPIPSWKIGGGESENSDRFYFLGLQNHCRL